jgi:hypothetical protein
MYRVTTSTETNFETHNNITMVIGTPAFEALISDIGSDVCVSASMLLYVHL